MEFIPLYVNCLSIVVAYETPTFETYLHRQCLIKFRK